MTNTRSRPLARFFPRGTAESRGKSFANTLARLVLALRAGEDGEEIEEERKGIEERERKHARKRRAFLVRKYFIVDILAIRLILK